MKQKEIKWAQNYFDFKSLFNIVVAILSSLLLPFAYQVLVEFVRIGSVHYTLLYLQAHWHVMLLGWLVLVLIYMALLALTARPAVPAFLEGLVLFAGAVAHYFKLSYRGEVLVPKDLFVAREGLNVARMQQFSLTREMIIFIVCILLATAILWFVRIPFAGGWKIWTARGLAAVVLVAFTGIYLKAGLWNQKWMNQQGLGLAGVTLTDDYYKGSFVTMFLHMINGMHLKIDDAYEEDIVSQLGREVEYARQNDTAKQEKPDIIVVMSESYYDLQNAIQGAYSENLTENFDRLAQEGISGYFLSEGYGGGTANIEFSVLTGYNIGFLPEGSTPYSEYMKEDFASYPLYLKQNGYDTIAVHSFLRTYYERPKAYEAMGFDRFYSMEDFEDPVYVGQYIGEQSTMEMVVQQYEELLAEGADHVFIHAVTMQNHMVFNGGIYPDEYRVKAEVEGLDEEETAVLETVATNLRDIDQALGWLADYLTGLDREVVLLFFGDHQPIVGDNYGNNPTVKASSYLFEKGAKADEEKYKVPFLMWSNYQKKEGEKQPLVADYLLLPILTKEYGVLRLAWFSWLYSTLESFRGQARGWLIGPDGTMLQENDLMQGILKKHELLQYDAMFGKKWAYAQMFR